MDIMTTLFDQDYITELYGNERRMEGIKEGKLEGILNSIRGLMQSLSVSSEKAMSLLMIPKEEQEIYREALSKQNEGCRWRQRHNEH